MCGEPSAQKPSRQVGQQRLTYKATEMELWLRPEERDDHRLTVLLVVGGTPL